MREPSAAAVAEGSVCVTELAKGAEVIRGLCFGGNGNQGARLLGRADVCLSAGRDRSQSMQVPRIAPDRPMRSLMLPAATFASRRACIPYVDAGGTRRSRRRRARPDPYPHRRRPKPRHGPRQAHGPPPFPDTGTAGRGHQAPRGGRYVAGIGAQLQCQ